MRTPSIPHRLVVRAFVIAAGLAIVATPLAAGVEPAAAMRFKPTSTLALAPGVTYQAGRMKVGGRTSIVRVVTLDPRHPAVRLKALLSNDKVVGRENSSHIAKRKSVPGMQAVVATNGDMSTRDRLDAYAAPQGLHIQDGELMVAQACARPTIGVDAGGNTRIGEVRVHVTLTELDKKIGKQVHRVNTHRDDAKVVLFTSRFAKSTKTAPGGVEVVLQMSDTLRPNGTQMVTVAGLRRGAGNTALQPGRAVLSVRSGNTNRWVGKLKPGEQLRLDTAVVRRVDRPCGGTIQAAGTWAGVIEALGGNHFTARDGRVAPPSRSVYPAGWQRHPRTNVGVTGDGRVVMVTVDGRQRGTTGLNLAQMGKLMLSLGARQSFNLDGGGSTVMARRFLKNGKFGVTNRPSDGRERDATQALAVFQVGP